MRTAISVPCCTRVVAPRRPRRCYDVASSSIQPTPRGWSSSALPASRAQISRGPRVFREGAQTCTAARARAAWLGEGARPTRARSKRRRDYSSARSRSSPRCRAPGRRLTLLRKMTLADQAWVEAGGEDRGRRDKPGGGDRNCVSRSANTTMTSGSSRAPSRAISARTSCTSCPPPPMNRMCARASLTT